MKKEVATIFTSPINGEGLLINRYPERRREFLQAWDASDDLLLYEVLNDIESKRILIINDSFGALACSLIKFNPVVYSDSFCSHMAIKKNSQNDPRLTLINDLATIQKGVFDTVLIKSPKSFTHLKDILIQLTRLMAPGAKLYCGIMIKHSSSSIFDLIENYIGKTTTSLARKKARVIKASFQNNLVCEEVVSTITLAEHGLTLKNYSSVFSNKKLDIGTRFFLDNFPNELNGDILDLGCANGILGIVARIKNPDINPIFCDDSFLATKSTKENYRSHLKEECRNIFWMNCYEDRGLPRVNAVLCNPPFHQQNTITKQIAYQMFSDAYHCLKTGGKLYVVANSHLGYHSKIKQNFKNAKIISSSKKFVIIEAIKRN